MESEIPKGSGPEGAGNPDIQTRLNAAINTFESDLAGRLGASPAGPAAGRIGFRNPLTEGPAGPVSTADTAPVSSPVTSAARPLTPEEEENRKLLESGIEDLRRIQGGRREKDLLTFEQIYQNQWEQEQDQIRAEYPGITRDQWVSEQVQNEYAEIAGLLRGVRHDAGFQGMSDNLMAALAAEDRWGVFDADRKLREKEREERGSAEPAEYTGPRTPWNTPTAERRISTEELAEALSRHESPTDEERLALTREEARSELITQLNDYSQFIQTLRRAPQVGKDGFLENSSLKFWMATIYWEGQREEKDKTVGDALDYAVERADIFLTETVPTLMLKAEILPGSEDDYGIRSRLTRSEYERVVDSIVRMRKNAGLGVGEWEKDEEARYPRSESEEEIRERQNKAAERAPEPAAPSAEKTLAQHDQEKIVEQLVIAGERLGNLAPNAPDRAEIINTIPTLILTSGLDPDSTDPDTRQKAREIFDRIFSNMVPRETDFVTKKIMGQEDK